MLLKTNFFVVLALTSYWSTISAQCVQVTPDNKSAFPYKQWSNRCEGFYEAKVGAPSVEVVGFYTGKFDFQYAQDEVLHVSSKASDVQTWSLQAIGIPLNYYYRMDAKLAANGTFEWYTKDVIYPKGISSDFIGVYLWKNEGSKKYYSPVSLQTKYKNDLNDGIVRLVIRISTAVNSIYWKPIGSKEKSIPINKTFSAGEAITIEIPPNMKGNIGIEITAKEKNSGNWVPKKIYLSL